MSERTAVPLKARDFQKENLNYEGRVRAEKRKDELVMSYTAYLEAHPEITPLLHDMIQHVLVQKPDRPLEAMSEFVRIRSSSSA
ncbi:hypothetical protein GH5_01684 [Leishmania sp. Ghana 2012 LV757]|uniref:hypothetical protein n=1 Tax=Leishmania sp. Ghana 2012 LV757 TaxID=2803181 RepID=UPI001B479AD1|nr:hypothetical protein GH5_01684 [Leishmania sp. Ghana 2012 LV757]